MKNILKKLFTKRQKYGTISLGKRPVRYIPRINKRINADSFQLKETL